MSNYQKDLVSIVITCYNYGRFLGEAIDSALSQTHKPLEVIVVNDGSTDETDILVKSYGNKIKYHLQSNGGVIQARNNGARIANGEFLCFFDADDILSETYVSELLAMLEINPSAAFAYSDMQYFGDMSGIYKSKIFSYFLLANHQFVNASALVRHIVHDDVGGFDELFRDLNYEDWDYWLSISELGYVGEYLPKPLLKYRRHNGGSRHKLNIEDKKRYQLMLEKIRDKHVRIITPLVWATGKITNYVDRIFGIYKLKVVQSIFKKLDPFIMGSEINK